MDDDEEDVFEPESSPLETTHRKIKRKDPKRTHTADQALVSASGMLPLAIVPEPRQPFPDNAGFRWHIPAHVERPGEGPEQPHQNMQRDGGQARLQDLHHQQQQHLPPHRRHEPLALSMEAHIGQKLRLIGDQFHGENLQQFHRNQRNQAGGGVWWRLASALLTLLVDRGLLARWGGAGRR